MVKRNRWQIVPTVLTLALVACEGSIMGVADPEVEFEAVASVRDRQITPTRNGKMGKKPRADDGAVPGGRLRRPLRTVGRRPRRSGACGPRPTAGGP